MDFSLGRVHVVRGSLGTRDKGAAHRYLQRIDIALADGPRSSVWSELRPVLPPRTFHRLVEYAGVPEKRIATWRELRERFESHKNQQVRMGQRSTETIRSYQCSLNSFESYIDEQGITFVSEITKAVLSHFQEWLLSRIRRANATGGATLELALVHLHHVFQFAIESELTDKNPVQVLRRKFNAGQGAQPFSRDELGRLKARARNGPPSLFGSTSLWLPYLLARWTGFRNWDAMTLPWDHVLFERKEIDHVCHKNNKRVIIPIGKELLPVLEAERQRRRPRGCDPVLLNPKTGRPFSNRQWYEFVVRLGEMAGVEHAHPYRFRDTFAVDMLMRFNNVFYVAQLLGDTVAVVTQHYLAYIKELRERTSELFDKGHGLE